MWKAFYTKINKRIEVWRMKRYLQKQLVHMIATCLANDRWLCFVGYNNGEQAVNGDGEKEWMFRTEMAYHRMSSKSNYAVSFNVMNRFYKEMLGAVEGRPKVVKDYDGERAIYLIPLECIKDD